MFVLSRL